MSKAGSGQGFIAPKREHIGNRILSLWEQYNYVVIFIAILIAYVAVAKNLTWGGVMLMLRQSAVIGIIRNSRPFYYHKHELMWGGTKTVENIS
ncbi:MAG: hypothetical protein LBK66_14660 [Spirochaetaceae bacterium]|jgi:hypothetical protein|nr:hypothetical protein [Spirochaetaceae bacterium]